MRGTSHWRRHVRQGRSPSRINCTCHGLPVKPHIRFFLLLRRGVVASQVSLHFLTFGCTRIALVQRACDTPELDALAKSEPSLRRAHFESQRDRVLGALSVGQGRALIDGDDLRGNPLGGRGLRIGCAGVDHVDRDSGQAGAGRRGPRHRRRGGSGRRLPARRVRALWPGTAAGRARRRARFACPGGRRARGTAYPSCKSRPSRARRTVACWRGRPWRAAQRVRGIRRGRRFPPTVRPTVGGAAPRCDEALSRADPAHPVGCAPRAVSARPAGEFVHAPRCGRTGSEMRHRTCVQTSQSLSRPPAEQR